MILYGLRNESKGFQPLAADIQGVETPLGKPETT